VYVIQFSSESLLSLYESHSVDMQYEVPTPSKSNEWLCILHSSLLDAGMTHSQAEPKDALYTVSFYELTRRVIVTVLEL